MIEGMTPQAVAKAYKWRQWGIFIVGLGIFGMLGWQLMTLDPKYYCQTTFDFSKTNVVGEVVNALKVCAQQQMKILSIKDHTIVGLVVAIILTQMLFLMSEFGYKGNLKGPGGTEAGFEPSNDTGTKKIEGEVTLTDSKGSEAS